MQIQHASVCTFKTSPCMPVTHAHMFQHVCACCRHTRGRFECTDGKRVESTHGVFSVPHHTTHTHSNTRRQRQRKKTEKEDKEKEKEKRRRRQEKRKEEMKKKKIMKKKKQTEKQNNHTQEKTKLA